MVIKDENLTADKHYNGGIDEKSKEIRWLNKKMKLRARSETEDEVIVMCEEVKILWNHITDATFQRACDVWKFNTVYW